MDVEEKVKTTKPFLWTNLPFFKSEDWEEIKKAWSNKPLCPSWDKVLRAFEVTPFDKTRVVLMGQDPYPNPKYACGLAFSIPRECTIFPPSLKNIFKELKSDLGCEIPPHGDLTKWGEQGVLLLNASLTCNPWEPGSHKRFWNGLLQQVVGKLVKKDHLIWVLWGRDAQDIRYLRATLYPRGKHMQQTIESPHPSPFSAHTGFFGSKPFSTINRLLKEFPEGENTPIDWDLTA